MTSASVPDEQDPGLVAERDFLLRSIADLESEFAAGDIDATDYEGLRAGYVERAAQVIRRLDAGTIGSRPEDRDDAATRASARMNAPSGSLTRRRRLRRVLGRRRTRTALSIGALLCLCCLVAIVAAHLAGVRLPGQPETGGITLSTPELVQQELGEASVMAGDGQVARAVQLYGAILALVPDQHEALTYYGWLTRLAGLAAHTKSSAGTVAAADRDLARAASIAPGYADARGLDGIALAQDHHDLGAAIKQFTGFLADRPDAALESALGPEIAAVYRAAGVAVPRAIVPYERGAKRA